MKRAICAIVALCLMLSFVPVPAARAAGEPCGSCGKVYDNGFCGCGYQAPVLAADGYYEIGNAGQLYSFAQMVNQGMDYFEARLTADIVVNLNVRDRLVLLDDGSAKGGEKFRVWTPMGYWRSNEDNMAACGIFDGCGYTISGLYFQDSQQDYVGLFGYAGGLTIQNLNIDDSYFRGAFYVGGFVGGDYAWIYDCTMDGIVSGFSNVGGFAGKNSLAVESCVNMARIQGIDSSIGGIVGEIESRDRETVNILECRNLGEVNSIGSYVGGIAGYAKDATVYDSINYGEVRGCGETGGIAGLLYDGEISGCLNHGRIISWDPNTGGIVGSNHSFKVFSTVARCGNTGEVSGMDNTGGIAGRNVTNQSVNRYSRIEYCWNTGEVADMYGNRYGGIAGCNDVNIGGNGPVIQKCFTTQGVVLGDLEMGSVTDSYYLDENAGRTTGIGNAMSAEAFASGQVAYLLGEPFGQNLDNGLGNPGYPQLDGETVYYGTVYDCEGWSCDMLYSNQPDPEALRHDYADGVCMACGVSLSGGEIVRLAGANRFDTAFMVADRLKDELGMEKFDTVIIASGANFADALSGSYLANVKNAPIILAFNETYNNKAKEYIRENLTPGGTVYILGGTAAVDADMEAGLEDFLVKRLAGANRFETNLLILREAGVAEGEEILVCTGTNFADSLSASAVGKPILLVWNEYGRLLDSQRDYMQTLQGSCFCVVGGENAVGIGLEAEVSRYGKVSRLAGKDRFETSVLVARRYFGAQEEAVLAYAWNYPDGLCGGPLACAMGCPLILTMSCYEAQARGWAEEQTLTGGVVLGGEKLISEWSAECILWGDGDPGHRFADAGENTVVCLGCGYRTKPEITLPSGPIILWLGETWQLDHIYTGTGELQMAISDEEIAVITDDGVITPVSAGTATIKVTDGVLTERISVRVMDPDEYSPTQSIRVSADGPVYDGVVKYAGDLIHLRIYVGPSNVYGNVKVTSSNPSVVSVTPGQGVNDPDFTLRYLSAGRAVITIASEDGRMSRSITIHVKKAYDFEPEDKEKLLTPEEFAEYVEMVAQAGGMVDYDPYAKIWGDLQSWRLAYVQPEDLTYERAVLYGQGHVREYWTGIPGSRAMQWIYVGYDSDFGYAFHTCF